MHKFFKDDFVIFQGKKHKVVSVWWDGLEWRYELKQVRGRGFAPVVWSSTEKKIQQYAT